MGVVMTRHAPRPAGHRTHRQRAIAEALLGGPLATPALMAAMAMADTPSARVSVLQTLRRMRSRGEVASTHTSLRTCVPLLWSLTPAYEARVRVYGTAKATPDLCRVLRLIAEADLPSTADEVASALRMDEVRVRSLLSTARHVGLVRVAGTLPWGRGRPHTLWRVTATGRAALADTSIITRRITRRAA
jgi:hypothetical protein